MNRVPDDLEFNRLVGMVLSQDRLTRSEDPLLPASQSERGPAVLLGESKDLTSVIHGKSHHHLELGHSFTVLIKLELARARGRSQ